MFDHCLYFNTAALARQLERLWAEDYKPFGLTAPQGFLLRAVLRRPGILQGQLAEALAYLAPHRHAGAGWARGQEARHAQAVEFGRPGDRGVPPD